MAEQASNTVERYLSKSQAAAITSAMTSFVLDHSGGGGGGGGSSSDPDGTTVINRDSQGEITSMVLTYNGGVRTTTFAKTDTSKIIVEYDVKTGAATAKVKTTTITGDTITQVTTTEPIEVSGD